MTQTIFLKFYLMQATNQLIHHLTTGISEINWEKCGMLKKQSVGLDFQKGLNLV